MEPDFILKFNEKKQYVEVFLHEVHPNTFQRKKGGRWGYFIATWKNRNSGKFGEIHFVKSRLRFDVIAHEILHALMEWRWENGETFTRKNEERLIGYLDRMVWRFLKELKKIDPKAKLW